VPELSLAVEVAAPPERVWAAFTDWDRQHEWMLGTTVEAGPDGHDITATTRLGPVRFVDTMVVTAWDPPYRCVVRHTGKVVRGYGAFEVEPGGATSTFRWTEWLELPYGQLGQLGFAAVQPLVTAGIRYSLNRFATWAASYRSY
jgi:carbon monoxide dehydrogenase subunit G